MNRVIPCVLMRAGTSRGPFFLREWLPADDVDARRGADRRDRRVRPAAGRRRRRRQHADQQGRDRLEVVAARLRRRLPVRPGRRRPEVGRHAAQLRQHALGRRRRSPSSRAWCAAQDGETTVRVFNVNTRSRIDVTVLTPGRRVTYDGETGIDGVAGTAAPIRLNFLDAWGAVTGSVFPDRPAHRHHRRPRGHLHRRRDAAGDRARRATSA